MSDEILFCKGGGCTAKLGPGALERVLSLLPKRRDENLLIGFDSSDDAAVYRLTDELAIVQTLDFFPPMVEDPYTFGKIAATNALSDVYAMGGEVKTAMNIVCFPQSWDLNILGEIMRGGAEKVIEAGGVLVGGHSINDVDVKYGLSVMGIVHPDKIYPNNGGHPGDKLIVTKKLGVGIISTAHRVGEASQEAMDAAIESMTTLNKYAAQCCKSTTSTAVPISPASAFWVTSTRWWRASCPAGSTPTRCRYSRRRWNTPMSSCSPPWVSRTATTPVATSALTTVSHSPCRRFSLTPRAPAA